MPLSRRIGIDADPSCTALVGGTSGIGEATLRALVQHTLRPRVYLIGRSREAATRIASEAKQLNDGSSVTFIESDATLLRNVDDACRQIKAKEQRVNLLFMTPGFLTLSGRNETSEGLDRKFALNYYTRLRFAHNLLPLLSAAAQGPSPSSTAPATSPTLSRVISVLAPSREGALNLSDLDLKTHYSLRACEAHAVTMTDLAFETLSRSHPQTSFLHSNPGGVRTNAARTMGGLAGWGLRMLIPVMTSLGIIIEPEESGERHLWAATSGKFRAREERADGAGKGEEEEVTEGSDGERGSGAYLIGPKGERTGKEDVLQEMRALGAREKVWEHTLEVFGKVEG